MRLVLTQPADWLSDGRANFDAVLRSAERSHVSFSKRDVVVLPELVGTDLSHAAYLESVRRVSRSLGAWVVGGTHHHRYETRTLNSGVVTDPSGAVGAHYHKLNPYGVEKSLGVASGEERGHFVVDGQQVLVVVCADLWHSESFAPEVGRDYTVVVVPTFSITQRRAPQPARELWRHMTIARAYELSAYVGVSDWGAGARYRGLSASGVAGLADPRPPGGNPFFRPLGRRKVAEFDLDFPRLRELRASQRSRSFLRQ